MQYKALSLFIRNLMETAQNPKFQSNLYHEALYLWHVEQKRDPQADWERAWSLAITPGVSSKQLTFLWKMVHDLLPSQARLFRLKMPNINSEICSLCDLNMVGNLTHSLLLCPYNNGAGQFLLEKLNQHIPNILPQQVVILDLDAGDDLKLPLVFMIASILSDIWESRKDKKPCHLNTIRAALEAGINILRKSRHCKLQAL